MPRPSRWIWAAVVLGFVASGCAWTVRATDDVNGGDPDDDVGPAALSDDGRWVAFESPATDLVAGDTNGVVDVFLHDELVGITTLVSKKNNGTPNDTNATVYGISGDGRYVLFGTESQTITSPTAATELYRYDRQTDSIEVVPGTTPGPGVLSGDGNTVAIDTEPQVFENTQDEVVDMATGVVSSPPGVWNSHSLSHDGRHLAHVVYDWNDPYYPVHAFVRDLDGGTDVALGKGASPELSADGTHVAFVELVELTPHNDEPRVSVRRVDDPDSLETIVGHAYASQDIAISGAGRFVSFTSTLVLVGDDSDALRDMYVFDRLSSTMRLVSRNAPGAITDADVFDGAIAGDGRTVAFTTTAGNMAGAVAGTSQLYLRSHPRPEVTAVSPSNVAPGASVTLTVSGSAFMATPMVTVDGGGATVDSVTWVDDGTLLIDVTVAAGAATGSRDVSVINLGTGPGPAARASSTCTGCLVVTAT
ncbi:MAG: IPT/TIG domain-containing protein [Acidimicrobiales bacterium]